ncbi:hypothetical protein BJ878DRAFT_179247 [Calycina marina]|uniref:Uncharacterized protein n=1 Tax=Calycina marina TaxID=1763456 RepID=A0A9P8CD21_9HELO|nr:hypothetical protein BJ878DRAFT_179247 [Calycina marina]
MMATEATAESIATILTTAENDLTVPESQSQDVPSDPPQPLVNGLAEKDGSKQLTTEAVGSAVVSAEVSVSGGSDTEASKTETSKAAEDGKGHIRTGSTTVKKIASFKPVSVNKTFLAVKSSGPAPPSKLGEKPATGSTSTPSGSLGTLSQRPRLVAKSGSALRDAAPRSSTANGGQAAPDASAVWNKNRPPQTPEIKRMTDEELKQRYGIHMATRLQSDDPAEGKQANNWADIDDDDDDWAPETIEWTDGTKITLPTAEETLAREPTPVPEVKEIGPIEIAKPKSPAPPQSAASPSTKTIGFGGRAGLVLKGVAEKPTLVAKPPGPPTPVKSPWASLPPIDKAAPIPTNLPLQQPPRFDQRNSHGSQGMPLPPAKEIAADDFSRSWREGQKNTRELYDSKSGRYEPVNDNRRGSRNDQPRQPAVLQRPPPQQDGPAEPSSAFQTHRAIGHDGNRRRTSSNISGGSGNVFRRMSKGDLPPPRELLDVRRGSLAAVSDAASSPRNFSPSNQFPRAQQNQLQQNPHFQSRASPSLSHHSPQMSHRHPIPPIDNQLQNPHEEAVKFQEQIMRQTREGARKRRQDEEAREEAAKSQRLKLKLEAMESLPEKKEKKEQSSDDKIPKQIQSRITPETVVASTLDPPPEARSDAAKAEHAAATPAQLPAKPEARVPVDTRRGIHAAPPTTTTYSENRNWQHGAAPISESPQPAWVNVPQQPVGRNVWGPPSSNDRNGSLGNGTFNPELSRLSNLPQGPRPGPIGTPRGNGQPQQSRNQYQYNSRNPCPIGPPSRQQPRNHSDRIMAVGWGDAPERLAREDAERDALAKSEYERKQELSKQGVLPPAVQPEIKETWRRVNIQDDGTRGKIKESTVESIDGSGIRLASNNTSSSVRISKFFPAQQDARTDHLAYLQRPSSPSPPPPTMEGHPVYDGDAAHPHVSLPQARPVVKLPPLPALIAPPRPISFAAALSGPAQDQPPTRPSYSHNIQDIRNNPAATSSSDPGNVWQEKISSLFDKKQKSNTLQVDSSSKNPLELPSSQSLATVSLPSSVSGDIAPDTSSIISKPPAEICFEEQEMGSLPVWNLPDKVPEALWTPAVAPKFNKKHSHLDAWSVLPFEVDESMQNSKNAPVIAIKVPGMTEPKSITLPFRQPSNGRTRGGQRGQRGSRHNSTHRGRGGRDASTNFSPSTPDGTAGFGRRGRGGFANHEGTPTRGGRGSSRGGSGNGGAYEWSKHPSPAPVGA